MNPLATPALAAGIMELNPGLTLWVAITFLFLIGVLAKFAFGPIVRMLDERERTIREAIEQARKEREEAERMMPQQKQALALQAAAPCPVVGVIEPGAEIDSGAERPEPQFVPTRIEVAVRGKDNVGHQEPLSSTLLNSSRFRA